VCVPVTQVHGDFLIAAGAVVDVVGIDDFVEDVELACVPHLLKVAADQCCRLALERNAGGFHRESHSLLRIAREPAPVAVAGH